MNTDVLCRTAAVFKVQSVEGTYEEEEEEKEMNATRMMAKSNRSMCQKRI